MDEKIKELMKIYLLPTKIVCNETIVLSHAMMLERERRLRKNFFDTQEAYQKYRNEVLKKYGKS